MLALGASLGLDGIVLDRFLWAAGYAPAHDYISEVLMYREAADVLIKARTTQTVRQDSDS